MLKKIKLIAETAWHHDGDYNFMMDLIDKIIHQTNVDIIKLHLTLDLDEYMTSDHPGYEFLKKRLFDEKQWASIISKIENSDKSLMLLFNDKKSIEFGMQFNPSFVEIHSVCLNDIHLLSKLKETISEKTVIFLGVGGSTLYEVENAISYLESENIVLMHGFQNYPTNYEDVNFSKIQKIINLFPEFEHGYADHTSWNEQNNVLITCLGAALGMNYIEKHVTTVPGEERTDWQASISFQQINEISANLKILERCFGDGKLKLNDGEIKYSIFGPNKKAAFLKRPIIQGEKLDINDIVFKRTSIKSEITQLDVINLTGKTAKCNLDANNIILKEKFE
jgi:N,N'-diacetyllegionaminate synthase